jgi:RNA polymerase sigma factor (sigma-70 family)
MLSDCDLLRRFADTNDQAAFAALVRRHGGMVLGVCRRALTNLQDAEDACQATFLILARKARRQRWQPSVANWLFATARNVSRRARVAALRRARREARAAVPEAVQPVDRMTGRELLAALDEELERLPARYSEPLVLCYLEGFTRDEAATRLGVRTSTIKIRLERGRKRLGAALAGRGCLPGVGLLALTATEAARAYPPRLLGAVLIAVAGSPPAIVIELARGVAVQAVLRKSSLAVLLMVVASALGFGAWSLMPAGARPPDDRAMPAKAKAPAPPAQEQAAQPSVRLTGRVLDPQGKPRAGARLLLVGYGVRAICLGTSGPDGGFTVSVAAEATYGRFLAASAPGSGVGFVALSGLQRTRGLDLRLVKDNVIRGRIVDTQGKPVAGIHVGVTIIHAFDTHSVDRFLAAWKNRMFSFVWPAGDESLNMWPHGGVPEAVTTDWDGRFALAGGGAERVVGLHVWGAGIADAWLQVVNRQGFDPRAVNETARNRSPIIVSGPDQPVPALYGPEPVIVADPGKVVRGVVREAGGGKPLAGVQVQCQGASAKTDARGRFEIRGVHKSGSYALWVCTDLAAGVVGRRVTIPDTTGYEPVSANISVTRLAQTAVVSGRIVDCRTGKGVHGHVHIGILSDNRYAAQYPDLDYLDSASSDEDGNFRIVTIPGPVLLMANVSHKYKPPIPDARYARYFPADHPGSYLAVRGALAHIQGNSCKVLMIRPGTTSVNQDIIVEPASRITVKIQDAEGRPVAGTFVYDGRPGMLDTPIHNESDTWVAFGVAESGTPQRIIVYQRARKLFGTLTLKGNEKGPVVVRMRLCGAVRGRIVGEDAKPRSGVNVNLTYYEGIFWGMHAFIHGAETVLTDADGMFVIDELIPGIEFQLWPRSARRGRYWQLLVKSAKVEPGRTTDLGTIRLRPAD